MLNCVSYPNCNRNYCVFDEKRISDKKDLQVIKSELDNPKSSQEVLESLYALNIMIDEGTDIKEINDKLYPSLSKYNQTKDPNLQVFLAGIYRKTKVPDAFGPLCAMLIQNSINPPKNCYFDPNEEIGGAILDYLA
ncbi:MAG: hypothetical protein E7Z89_00250 [Cyanobacteria bacterium SIG28]|nr:hypothetical protein [Cyanobacteria bacterium SIG28]